MSNTPIPSIEAHFATLSDPRVNRTKKHKLLDIIKYLDRFNSIFSLDVEPVFLRLTPHKGSTSGRSDYGNNFVLLLIIAICAVICGADGWVAVEAFGHAKHDWLATFLQLPYGIPSHDTFGRVFGVLDSKQFERCFFNWIAAVSELTQGEIIPIDGKQLRRSHDREDGKAAIHLVSAWSSVNGLALGQVEVTDKSNEITAFPKLLEVLDISGCIVTIDAMGCQTEIAEKIVEAGGDYVLALKKNQGHLYEDVKLLFLGLQENPIADAYTDCDLEGVLKVIERVPDWRQAS